MKKSRKRYLIIPLVITLLFITGYFALHFPIGSFKYVSEKDSLCIRIYLSQSLLTFQDPVYNKSVEIIHNGKKFHKSYWSEVTDFAVSYISDKESKFFVIDDPFRGYSRCDNGSDFFEHTDDLGITASADTLYQIVFKDFHFLRTE